jgi:hypothetical protein
MDDFIDDSSQETEGPTVTGVSGADFPVMNEAERDYFTDKVTRYMADNHFSNVTDLQDIDRLLQNELLTWRWGNWLLTERDYDGNLIDLDGVKKSFNDYSKEIRLLKKSLGIDKVTRDREKGESVVDYIANLRRRAKEFGVVREAQLTKALTLFNELKSLIHFHDGCSPDERIEQDIEEKDIIEWIRNIAIPEYDAIDEHFREKEHKYWVREI